MEIDVEMSVLATKPSSKPTSKPMSNPGLPPKERRLGPDRRVDDKGPPGRSERRRGLESRRPEVVELDMSTSEWADLTRDVPPVPKK